MKKTLLGGFVLLALFSSCKKDDETPADTAKKYLVKIEDVADPLSNYTFTYNSSNVFTAAIDNYLGDNNQRLVATHQPVFTNSVLTGVIAGKTNDFSDAILRYQLDYDSQGKITRIHYKDASAPDYDSYDSLTYNIAARTVYVFSAVKATGEPVTINEATALKWDEKGNLTDVYGAQSSKLNLAGIETNYRSHAVYTYDSKPNPYVAMATPYFWFIADKTYYQPYASQNNVTKDASTYIARDDNGTILQESHDYTTYTYTYDAAGNPLTTVVKGGETDNPTTVLGQLKYTYK